MVQENIRVLRMARACDCCRGREFAPVCSNYDRMYMKTGETFSIARCRECGLEFIDPQPSKSKIGEFYPQNYGSLGNDSASERFEGIRSRLFRLQAKAGKNAASRILFLLAFPFYRVLANRSLPMPNGSRKLLDVGCGDGKFLSQAKKLGYSVFGVEPFGFNPALSEKEGFEIRKCRLPEAEFAAGYFDVVTMNHVMEHVDSPSEIFAELGRIVKPGGKAIIATPNSGSFGRGLFGKYWYHLDTPRHLFLMGMGNIRKYAEANGFRVAGVNNNGDFSGYLDSVRYVLEARLGTKLKIPLPIKILLIPGFSALSEITNALGCGDFIEVTLERQG